MLNAVASAVDKSGCPPIIVIRSCENLFIVTVAVLIPIAVKLHFEPILFVGAVVMVNVACIAGVSAFLGGVNADFGTDHHAVLTFPELNHPILAAVGEADTNLIDNHKDSVCHVIVDFVVARILLPAVFIVGVVIIACFIVSVAENLLTVGAYHVVDKSGRGCACGCIGLLGCYGLFGGDNLLACFNNLFDCCHNIARNIGNRRMVFIGYDFGNINIIGFINIIVIIL